MNEGSSYIEFEDSLEGPPVWPMRLTLTDKDLLFTSFANDLDPEIGNDFYSEVLEQTSYVLLSLLSRSSEHDPIILPRIELQ